MSLISKQDNKFMNSTIKTLTHDFITHHHTINPCHLQAYGIIETFNNILAQGLMKVCNVNRDDWDERILVLLWENWNMIKKFTNNASFSLVYDREVVILLQNYWYQVCSLH
jgi:hypothetical protein